MGDPRYLSFVFGWTHYLVGKRVHCQNHVIFLEKLTTSFNLLNMDEHVLDRSTVNEDGIQISEWSVSRTAVADFRLDSIQTRGFETVETTAMSTAPLSTLSEV
ncbi:hypothetical protein VARIO8X_60349 [Burkholderiales bacterium 8X]|nr:hypothetical protein VARIO8X_60349 [Burkholderiales bacterium 8X]